MEEIRKSRIINTSPDKREMMMLREVLKTLLIMLLTSLVWAGIFEYTVNNKITSIYELLTNEKEEKSNKILKESLQLNFNKQPILYVEDLRVVIKTSKDIHKYFVSYKKYYSWNKYNVKIKQISFQEYMTLSTNDTLTSEKFN